MYLPNNRTEDITSGIWNSSPGFFLRQTHLWNYYYYFFFLIQSNLSEHKTKSQECSVNCRQLCLWFVQMKI